MVKLRGFFVLRVVKKDARYTSWADYASVGRERVEDRDAAAFEIAPLPSPIPIFHLDPAPPAQPDSPPMRAQGAISTPSAPRWAGEA